MDEQLYIRKVLETFIEIPDVLYTLILKFVGPYEWKDLETIPLGVTCTCMLDVTIYMYGMLTMWCKKKLYRCDKIYVTRWADTHGSEFTFKLTIDGKSYELLHGMAYVNAMEFKTGKYSRVVFTSVEY